MKGGFRLTGDKLTVTEKDVERACVEALRWRHFYPLRLQSGRFIMPDRAVIQALEAAGVPYRMKTVGEPGIPDYVIPAFFVEMKSPRGKLGEIQRKKIATLKDYWNLLTAVPKKVEDLIEWLDQYEAPPWKA